MIKKRLYLIIFLLIANVFILFANIPYIVREINTPPESRYALVHLYPIDYYLYLTIINQGKNGDLLFDHPYTSERNFTPSIIYIFYILVGKIASILKLWPPVVYTIIKILSAEFFVINLFLLCELLFGTNIGFLSALLSLVITALPEKLMGSQIWFIFTPWWYSYNAFERLDMLPHHELGQALLLLSVFFIIKFIRSRKKYDAVIAGVIIFVQGIIFPPTLSVILFGIPTVMISDLLIQYLKNKKIIFDKKLYSCLFLILIISGLSFIIIKSQELLGFPWNLWTPWEVQRWNVNEPGFNTALFKLFIPGIIFFIISFIPILKSKKLEFIFILSWAIVPFVLLPWVNIFSIPKIRLVQEAPYVPFGILSVYALVKVFPTVRIRQYFYMFIGLYIVVNLFIGIQQYLIKINYFKNNPDNYFSKNILSAFDYLNENAPRRSIVLSYEYIGIAIPSFTKSYVYFGQLAHTKDFFIKKDKVIAFLKNQWDPISAREFLKQNNISYIYFGKDEKEISGGKITYPFIESVFSNDDVTIYKVTDKNS